MTRVTAAAFLLAGILVVLFKGSERGVNGWSVLGVVLAFVGIMVAARAEDRARR